MNCKELKEICVEICQEWIDHQKYQAKIWNISKNESEITIEVIEGILEEIKQIETAEGE